MRRYLFFLMFLVLLVLFSQIAFAQEDSLLPLQGIAKKNGAKLTSGNIIVEIYDAPTGGNLIYNSTNDFTNVISSGEYDILLGNGSRPLSLNYGRLYYMDMYLNGVDMDFNNSERKVFMSNVGNISMTTPLRTNSTDTDNALNISNGGAFIGGDTVFNNFFNVTTTTSAVSTNGSVVIRGSQGTGTEIFIVHNGFNISRDANILVTNGSIAIQAFGESRPNAFTVNRGFNISGADSAVRTNSTVTIVTLLSPALSINGFNVSGASAVLETNSTITIDTNRKQAFTVNQGFNVTGANDVVTNGTITILSFLSPALAINGFNVSGSNAALSTNGTVTILSRLSPALAINGFNVSGASAALSTNGTVTIAGLTTFTNTDADDALNITQGGTFMTGNLTVGSRNAGVFINEQGSIVVGNASSTNDPHVEIFDGGTDNCASLILYDETGAPFYIFVAGGLLKIKSGAPSDCSTTDGTTVGTQS